MELSEKTQRAYNDWKMAKVTLKLAREIVKDAQANDVALADAEEAKKLAVEAWKAERYQFDGKHASLLEKLAEAKAAEKDAHLHFTDCYTTAMAQQLAFDLFDEGRKGEVTVATRAKVVQEKPAQKPANHDDDGGAA